MNDNKYLTPKQEKLLNFILEFKKTNSTAPSMAEMMKFMGVTVSAVHNKLESLHRKKLI